MVGWFWNGIRPCRLGQTNDNIAKFGSRLEGQEIDLESVQWSESICANKW